MSSSPSSSPHTWDSQAGYVWSLIGSAVGFANVLSFSAKAYQNGGGAFMIPYLFALFTLGIPLLILEGLVGYHTKAPLVAAFGQTWGVRGKILGWLSVLACLTIGSFYVILTGYALAYVYFSGAGLIPEDSGSFFLNDFLKLSPSLTEPGAFSWSVFFSSLGVLGFSWLVLIRHIKDGIEKVCSLFMPLLAIMMAGFAVVVCFLPGGLQGWSYYLSPDFSRLWDPSLWRDVFGQLFFSLSLGLGIVVGYSRHTKKTMNIPRAMLYVALGDFAVSFISGGAIFGCLAHMSQVQGIPFQEVLTSSSPFDIGFVVFPKILSNFGPYLSQGFGALFFFCVFIAGITGVFSIIESIAGNIEIEFHFSRKKAVTITVGALLGFGLFFCMGNASHLIEALAPMVMGTNMLIGGLGLIFGFFYSPDTALARDPVWRSKSGSLGLNGLFLKYLAPGVLGLILMGTLFQEGMATRDLGLALRWVWFGLAFILARTLSKAPS
jgi:NSS family neurotransmitter:Na+ symporter